MTIPAISFSVVIPLYNKASHIVPTISSVLHQTHPPIEIVVVDDGSTDGSAELIQKEFGEKINLIRQINKGVSTARNTGVLATRSNYVAFLDADDVWHPNHLATLSLLIEQFPGQGLYSTAHEIRQGKSNIRPASPYPSGTNIKVENFFEAMAFSLALVNSSTACASRHHLIHLGGFPTDVKRGEDIIVWTKLAHQFGMAHSNTVTSIYNKNAENRCSNNAEIYLPGSLIYLHHLYKEEHLSDEEKYSLGKLYDTISFYTVAGFKAEEAAFSIVCFLRDAFELRRAGLLFRLVAVFFAPASFLRWLKEYRHKHRK